MSVQTMAAVWRGSRHGGSSLLMMLAIGDFADDEGRAYPAVPTLARKCRTSARNANRILAGLRDSGELEIAVNDGPKGTNLYKIVFSALKVKKTLTLASSPDTRVTLSQMSVPPDASVLKPLTPASDEPSRNHHEPSGTSLARPKPPVCPFAEIVNAYHEVLPELPEVRLMDSKGRRTAISDFWRWVLSSAKRDGSKRAQTAEEALAWIHSYFGRVRVNDFLMGRTSRSEGHSSWRCDFDYLLSEKGKRQVIEKTEAEA